VLFEVSLTSERSNENVIASAIGILFINLIWLVWFGVDLVKCDTKLRQGARAKSGKRGSV
jgi:hypothetical protein